MTLLKMIRNSKADVIMLADGDVLFPTNTIEQIMKQVKDKQILYYINRVLLSIDTSKKFMDNEITIDEVRPKGYKTKPNPKYRGIKDKDRVVDNYPGTPAAYGYCQIGSRELMNLLMPNVPMEGWYDYDTWMMNNAENKQLRGLTCYHLNHLVTGLTCEGYKKNEDTKTT